MIKSSSNQQMKQISQLQKKTKARWEQRVFVVEGPKMCFEAPKGWMKQMYVSESFLLEAKWKEQLDGYQYELVADSIFKSISDTKTPQGILGLVQMPGYTLDDVLVKNSSAGILPHLLLLENVQDPGNLGTIIRTGEGAGITGIIMNKNTVDVFNPKVVRATMGSIYRVPFFVADDFKQVAMELKKRGVALYAAHLKGNMSYDAYDYRKGVGFFIGNEGNGLSDEMAALADAYIRIPMEGQVESLNAAIAAALLTYEVNRQRKV